MNCIFCKQNSSASKSVEHIIPESLGNKQHILPKGIVCDRCNNYFSNKIEKPLMELPYFVSVRHRNRIRSKKGRIPVENGILLGEERLKVNLHIEDDGNSISFDEHEAQKGLYYLQNNLTGTIVVPVNQSPPDNEIYMSKLLGKVAIEALAKVAIDVEGGIEDVVGNVSLDLLKGYVRFGNKVKFWPYSARVIYPEGFFFKDSSQDTPYEILHEYKLFQTTPNIWHIGLIMFGVEYCLNMSNPTIKDYDYWLKSNVNKSPLYID